MQPDVGITHLAFDFRFWNERCDRIDNDDIDGTAANKRVGDFQRLLPIIRLRNQQIVDINAQLSCV